MGKNKEFFTKTFSEDSGALSYEKYYTNIRNKKKIIEEFKKRIIELGECEESALLKAHCIELQDEIIELMDLFRGKIKAKRNHVVYVPMDIHHAFDYLGYLINDDIIKHIHTIRNLMNAIQYETGATEEDRNQIAYYRKLVNFFKDQWGRNRKLSKSQ